MSLYGKRWLIDGVPTGFIMRSPINGQYTVTFEREFATLDQIEAINWANPTIEYVGPHKNEDGLPAGYGFEVADIGYQSTYKSFVVCLTVGSQFLGDVTGYHAQIKELEASLSAKDDLIREKDAIIHEQEKLLSTQAEALNPVPEEPVYDASGVEPSEGEVEQV